MHVYEKLDGMSAWLLGFITLRELLDYRHHARIGCGEKRQGAYWCFNDPHRQDSKRNFWLDSLNITCPGGPCGYHMATDLQSVISMLNVGMERGVVDFQTVFILWLSGFILCYFVFCIIAEAHGILEEAKKTLPQ
jgi:hypothetical protein